MIRLTSFRFAVFALAVCLIRADSGRVPPPCAPVSGERITGGDMAAAVPQLASLPLDLTVGYSPLPGVRRVFLASDLRRLAHKEGIDADISAAVCFAWPLHALTKEALTSALQNALAGNSMEFTVIDQSRTPVPAGDLVFPLQSLTANSSSPAFWAGYVRYAENRKFAIWVKLQITVHEEQVVVTHSLRAGELIQKSDLTTVTYSGPMRRSLVVHLESLAIGKCAVRPIQPGTVLSDSMLGLPLDVERQELVTVHVTIGAAHIETQGIAVEGGHKGEIIKVRNPRTGSVFLAEIEEHGVVHVVPGGDVGLVVKDKKS